MILRSTAPLLLAALLLLALLPPALPAPFPRLPTDEPSWAQLLPSADGGWAAGLPAQHPPPADTDADDGGPEVWPPDE
ncbi:hypothetical protein DFJ74DRAFT_700586 [Hyaloraphidium curvatum]|nr:hypothetical protein DFJ74DRAFT_714774 [Hyaloraphidium curvatum]KAI9034189.1 hypothetical protein DFJ74DRAFT_700586 [Hyaloraphidium curvatum]